MQLPNQSGLEHAKPVSLYHTFGANTEQKEEVETKKPKTIFGRLIIPHNSRWKNIFDFIILI